MAFSFDQPLHIKNSSCFVQDIESYFGAYKKHSERIVENIFSGEKDKKFFINKTKKNAETIVKCLKAYQNGHRLTCAESFKGLMIENSDLLKDNIDLFSSLKQSNQTFYRIRRGKIDLAEIKKSPNHTLFHIPFYLRHSVGNGRFNAAGIPIFYVSDSLKIPYLECQKPSTEFCSDYDKEKSLNIGFFRNSKSFSFFDFSIKKWDYLLKKHESNPLKSELLNYLILFPIIAAIHVKIKFTKKVSFHFDYIFSSLIMDWVKNLEFPSELNKINLNYPISVIRYSSVELFENSSTKDTNECYQKHNYAFLTKYYKDSDHCLKLESLFINNGGFQMIYGNNEYLKKFKDKKISENDLKKIEESLNNGYFKSNQY